MIDPHEEQYLDLPEMNQKRIDENRDGIVQNRIIIGVVLAVNIFVIGFFYALIKHDIEQCQESAAKHIMGKTYKPLAFNE